MQVWNSVKSAGITQLSFQVESNAESEKTSDASGTGDSRAEAK